MTLKGSTAQACAACKYQRRRCLPECRLAPYFPSDQPKMFQNAHRLFGVSNILKILKIVDPSKRSETVRSIIYESNMRQKNPVLGCYGVIQQLHYEVRVLQEQLHAIRLQIDFYKMQQQPHQNKPPNSSNTLVLENLQNMDTQNNIDSGAMIQLRMATANHDDNDQNVEQFWGIQPPIGYEGNLMDQLEMSMDDHQQQQYLFDIQQREDMSLSYSKSDDFHSQQQREEMLHHFKDMHPFVNCGGQSFIDSKIAYDLSSSGSDGQSPSLRGLMDGAGQHQVAE